MNTPDLKKAISEIRRVLASGGHYAFYEVFAGDDSPPHFPVPWASSEQSSFLLPTEKFKDLLESAGFQTIAWQDQSSECLTWFRKRLEIVSSAQTPAQPGMELVMGENLIEKSANVVRNLEEQRIRVVMGLAVSR